MTISVRGSELGSGRPKIIVPITAKDLDGALDAVGALVEDWPLIASAEVAASKPDPRIFALACESIGTTPDVTVMVGDDPWSDVDGATGAGLRCVHLRRSPSAPSRPVATIDTLARLVVD